MTNEDRSAFLPRVASRPLTALEPIVGADGVTVGDYWQWAYSDIIQNIQRGIFAEFLVASALGITAQTRVAWSGYDLEYEEWKLEVKSSSYLQGWNQRALSSPGFGIGPRQQLDTDGIAYRGDPRYVADCFVFCLFASQDPGTANIVDVQQWRFYAVPITRLIEFCKSQKTVSLATVIGMTSPVTYDDLRGRLDALRAGQTFHGSGACLQIGNQNNIRGAAVRARAYLVAERATKRHAVIVNARDHREAHVLGRQDPAIAALGTQISAIALSRTQLEKALHAGAKDMRTTVVRL